MICQQFATTRHTKPDHCSVDCAFQRFTFHICFRCTQHAPCGATMNNHYITGGTLRIQVSNCFFKRYFHFNTATRKTVPISVNRHQIAHCNQRVAFNGNLDAQTGVSTMRSALPIDVIGELTSEFLIQDARIVLARFIQEGRIFRNRVASPAGPSIFPFNRVNEVGRNRQLHITGRSHRRRIHSEIRTTRKHLLTDTNDSVSLSRFRPTKTSTRCDARRLS